MSQAVAEGAESFPKQLCGCDASLESASKTLSTHNAYKRAQKAHADISCGHASRFTLSDSVRAWAADPMIWKGPK
jgi:hypothetical protein